MSTAVTLEGPVLVNTDSAAYLVAEGEGGPRSPEFHHAAAAVRAVAETARLQLELEGTRMPPPSLEAQWWRDDDAPYETPNTRHSHWKVLLPVPPDVDGQLVRLIKDSLVKARHLDEAADVRLEELPGGKCVQAFHVGPYSDLPETLARIHAFMLEAHMQPAGPRHEIYLSEIDRTDPQRQLTLILQPVR